MSEPAPPSRDPHYGDTEIYGWTPRDCALGLISTLSSWCKRPFEFKGAANGRIWHFEGDFTDRAQLLFESDIGSGRLELTVHATYWVMAEIFVGDDLKLRCWLEDPFEEKEFYPDGSEGLANAEGDAPGRISKGGRWLQIRCADFPGVHDDGTGYWDLEDTYD